MKKIIILSIGLFILTIYGLNAQENQNSEPKYRFFNEYGFFTGSTWTKTENGGDIGISGIFVNGVQVDKTHFVGFGLGYESGLEIGQGIPFFINYRHFFDKGYKIKPFMNVAVGTRLHFWEERYYIDDFGILLLWIHHFSKMVEILFYIGVSFYLSCLLFYILHFIVPDRRKFKRCSKFYRY